MGMIGTLHNLVEQHKSYGVGLNKVQMEVTYSSSIRSIHASYLRNEQ